MFLFLQRETVVGRMNFRNAETIVIPPLATVDFSSIGQTIAIRVEFTWQIVPNLFEMKKIVIVIWFHINCFSQSICEVNLTTLLSSCGSDICTKLWARKAALWLTATNVVCTASDEERGLTAWRPISYTAAAAADDDDDDDANVKVAAMTTYDLSLITPVIKRSHWSKYIPICSTFSGFSWMRCYSKKHHTTATDSATGAH